MAKSRERHSPAICWRARALQPWTVPVLVTYIRDGDTIEVAGVPNRFADFDRAEMVTNEGQSAGSFQADLVQGQTVTCNLECWRSHDREVGSSALTDSGEILIRERVFGRW